LNKRTSINSISNILKEKEMADFRKMLFAFAAVALLAGLTVPANAQSACTAVAGANTTLRSEGNNELVSDIVLKCTGGTPTAVNVLVPQVDIVISLNQTITSRITATIGNGVQMNEALLLMDEPNGAQWNNLVPGTTDTYHPILNCGAHSEDSSTSGPGVCAIYSDGNAYDTYDGTYGTAGTLGTCRAAGDDLSAIPTNYPYGCGPPNVFQGRYTVGNNSTSNAVEFLGIPYDAPSAGATRTLRFTNFRVNANGYGVASPFTTVPVIATFSISNVNYLFLTTTTVQLAQVQQGLISTTKPGTFLQCETPNSSTMDIHIAENFPTAFKVKNIAEILSNGVFASTNYTYQNTLIHPADQNQNVSGGAYGTETGFTNVTGANSSANPPAGFGTPVTGTGLPGTPFTNTGVVTGGTGFPSAGLATQGTRIAIVVNATPTMTTMLFPLTVALKNQATTNQTGVLQLVQTDALGADINGTYSPATALTGAPCTCAAGTVNGTTGATLAVYEVLFEDPNSFEYADIVPFLSYVPNVTSDIPPAPTTVTDTVSFAPFGEPGSNQPSATLPEPRFQQQLGPSTLYTISLCQCDLLFPWVVGGGGYATSIVVDNTALDPFGTAKGASGGTVTFNYYGTNGVSLNPANTGTFAAQTTTVPVPPGSYAVNIVNTSGSAGTAGLAPLSGAFAGYVISQSNFQFCHGVASISGNGIQPQTYVGLELDPAASSLRVLDPNLSESLGH
jgi:hypothetical protein